MRQLGMEAASWQFFPYHEIENPPEKTTGE
jgi:hypothetical protein